MANTVTAAKARNKGVVKVGVFDDGSGEPLVGATVALYPANAGDAQAFAGPGAQNHISQWLPQSSAAPIVRQTDAHGYALFTGLVLGSEYVIRYENYPGADLVYAVARSKHQPPVLIQPAINPTFTLQQIETPDGQASSSLTPRVGDFYVTDLQPQGIPQFDPALLRIVPVPPLVEVRQPGSADVYYSYPITRPGPQRVEAHLHLHPYAPLPAGNAAGVAAPAAGIIAGPPAKLLAAFGLNPAERPPSPISGNIGVSLTRTETEPTADLALWTLIRNSTDAMSFAAYQDFIDGLFCGEMGGIHGVERERLNKAAVEYEHLKHRRALPFTDSEAYRVLKAATEAFVMVNCGVRHGRHNFDRPLDNAYLDRRDLPDDLDMHEVLRRDYLEHVGETRMLPYLAIIRRKLHDIPIIIPHGRERDAELCFGIVQDKLSHPCLLELIWSYWHEEGMLVQTMNAITQRFQNVRGPGVSEALANSEIDMLRPLNNLIWGYTQDEQHRLTVVRRNYEYDHHYGVRLEGKAVQHFRPADSRSKFLEAFHHLLRLATSFYKQDDDTTVKADAFPVLNALKEVHLILSQGAHNQFGDLPSTARIEMLMQQWLLARPEFREFLPTRIMVAYPEPWMDRVDAMKRIQNWTDTSVVHFQNLAAFGEQLLLSIRYGAWSKIYEPTPAFNWARFWRPQVQGYVHAYRAATGVDLSIEARDTTADATIPAVLLRQRLAEQARAAGKSAGV